MSTAAFAYSQVRLQARHAQRPGTADWRLLQEVGDTVHFLQVARRTRLRRWVLALQGEYDSHRVELILRRQFQDYADEVLHWLPSPWDMSSAWFKRLPELPAIQYLLNGAQPPPWMRDDPRLHAFSGDEYPQRLQALLHSDCAPLVAAWQRGESISTAWCIHWRSLWAGDGARHQGLEQFTRLLQRALQFAGSGEEEVKAGREFMLSRLTAMFRRYAFQPAACYAHLALTALDLTTLRGELLRRMLFAQGRLAP